MNIGQDLEQDMKRLGVFIKDKEFQTPARMVGVKIELGLPKDAKLDLPDLIVETVTKRGVSTYFSDFTTEERGDIQVLTFYSFQPLPDDVILPAATDNLYCTSFLDLCWYIGNEAVPTDYVSTTLTPKLPEANSADLGYYMSARFLDSFIDSLGKMNDIFFSGALEDAMVYGTYTKGSNS